jgi:SagB-type dehydrogenase family enzyme
VMEARHSGRNFSARNLDLKQLGSLFAALATTTDGRRVWPSGGAKYPIEAYGLLLRAEAPLEGKIVYYNADRHSFSSVGQCPSWDELAPVLSFSADPYPAAVVVLVGFPARNTQKYGERGGRFILFEAGICMQNLSLRAQQSGLEGVLLGGLHDDSIKVWLGLGDTEAQILGGFACGRAPAAKWRFSNPFAPAG